MRVDRLVSNLGYCTRGEVAELIKDGTITHIDGVKLEPSSNVSHSDILYDNAPLDPIKLLIVLHKPLGFVCSHSDSDGKSIYELLPPRYRAREPKISTIGRLDKDSSGLILLSDDGELNHLLTAPKNKVAKTYIAHLARECDESAIKIFSSGELMLRGEKTPLLPAKLEILESKIAKIEIVEGRYHQVRRMFAAIGNHVESLHRISFGDFTLDDLAIGQMRLSKWPDSSN